MSPRPAPALCDCFVLPSLGLSLLWEGATAAGAEALHAVASKSVKKNISRISTKPIYRDFLGISSLERGFDIFIFFRRTAFTGVF